MRGSPEPPIALLSKDNSKALPPSLFAELPQKCHMHSVFHLSEATSKTSHPARNPLSPKHLYGRSDVDCEGLESSV